jgi:hypothetical protein
MAEIVIEPLGGEITYTQWARLIHKTTVEAGGFMALGLANMNGAEALLIARGSRVEAGGSIYKCESDETIGGTPTTGVNYIYCNPAVSAAGFTFSATALEWSAVYGGWYNGNSRAVAKLYFTGSSGGGQYNNKVILDNYNAIRAVNAEQGTPNTGGALISGSGSVNSVQSVSLAAGTYRVEIKAGKGGDGAKANKADGSSGTIGGEGGCGVEGQALARIITLDKQYTAKMYVGGDGNNADPNSYTNNGGGGAEA